MSFVVRVLGNMVGIWLASILITGIALPHSESAWVSALTLAVIALVFTLVNSMIRPVIRVLALPLYLLTFGLFSLVVNAIMLMVTGWLTANLGMGLIVDGFWSAFAGGLVTAIAASLVTGFLRSKRSSF